MSGRPRTRFAWAGLAVAMLIGAAGCGGGSSGPVVGSSPTSHAFATCVREHGGPPAPESSRKAGSPAARATDACKHLLSSGSTVAVPTRARGASSPGPGAVATDCLSVRTSPCYTPMQLRAAYGIEPLLDRGITGRGQTVVLPEFPPAAEPPSTGTGAQVPASSDIRQDVTRFDRIFHLPPAKLQVVNGLAHAASPWLASTEEVGDTEVVHALAPGAVIREVLIPSPYVVSTGRVVPAVVAALRLALTQAGVVSFSGGTGEQCFTPAQGAEMISVLRAARRKHVTMIVSTGDSGAATTACPPETGSAAVKGVDLPASDPLALAVGGTSLRVSRTSGAYIGETAWNTPASAGGGTAGGSGFSRLFARPAYQRAVDGSRSSRGVPDVAADADFRPGIAVAFQGGRHDDVLVGGGGTSVAAPLWAAIIALADQDAGRHLGFVNPALYRIGLSSHYHQAFHDVTTGTNTIALSTGTIAGYRASPGWDPLTGWGSPDARALVPLLTRYAGP